MTPILVNDVKNAKNIQYVVVRDTCVRHVLIEQSSRSQKFRAMLQQFAPLHQTKHCMASQTFDVMDAHACTYTTPCEVITERFLL